MYFKENDIILTMQSPFISIIIPTLNEEKYLPKLLTDFKKQKNKNFEIVIVDGHSEDKTKKLAGAFKKEFDLTIIDSVKRGVSYQKNLGAENAKGRYLVFLDADSRVNASFTQNISREIEKSHYLLLLPQILPQQGTSTDRILFNLYNFFLDLSQSIGKPLPSIGCMVFEKEFFHFIEGYVEGQKNSKNFFPEDHDIILRARRYGVLAKYCPSIKIGYSLRRYQREGRSNVIMKMFMSSIQMSFKGKLIKELFEYEMGGHLYSTKQIKNEMKKDIRKQQFHTFMDKFTKNLRDFIS
jgi:glycosyltransferase involved in cell wall biosynthesis